MNRREFLSHPAIPATVVGVGCVAGGVAGAMGVGADDGYIRVPAVGTRVRVVRGDDEGGIGEVKTVFINGNYATAGVHVQFDRPVWQPSPLPYVSGLIGVTSSSLATEDVEPIDPDPRWILVPRPK